MSRLPQGVRPDKNQGVSVSPKSLAVSLPIHAVLVYEIEPLTQTQDATLAIGEPVPLDWLDWSVFIHDVAGSA